MTSLQNSRDNYKIAESLWENQGRGRGGEPPSILSLTLTPEEQKKQNKIAQMIIRLLGCCGRIRREEGGGGEPPSILSLTLTPGEKKKTNVRNKRAEMIRSSVGYNRSMIDHNRLRALLS